MPSFAYHVDAYQKPAQDMGVLQVSEFQQKRFSVNTIFRTLIRLYTALLLKTINEALLNTVDTKILQHVFSIEQFMNK